MCFGGFFSTIFLILNIFFIFNQYFICMILTNNFKILVFIIKINNFNFNFNLLIKNNKMLIF